MSKPSKKDIEAKEAKKKAERVRVVGRLLFFIFSTGCIASAIILSMLISGNEYQIGFNIVAGLNSLTAVYFVLKLIFD